MSAWKKVGEGFKSVRGKEEQAGTETAEKIRKKRRVRASWDVGCEGTRSREGMNTGKCDKLLGPRRERSGEGWSGQSNDDTNTEHRYRRLLHPYTFLGS